MTALLVVLVLLLGLFPAVGQARNIDEVTTLPVLFENGQWAPELGEITVQTPRGLDGQYMWAYEDGMIRITNDISGSLSNSSVPFRWVFENTIDIRGYTAVVMELENVPTGSFLRKLRFRIDEDNISVGTISSTTVRLTSFTDAQRLRGVGALPSFGEVVRIKKIYLEGDGVITTPATISRREIRDVIPPRTGNTPVREITTSPQYTGTVEWSPDHATFQENTVYTATITLTPRPGWTLSGVAANWFRLYDITGNDAANTLTHAAGASVLTKTFAATTPVVPYPDPTQFIAIGIDDTVSPETNDLLDVLDANQIKAIFFTIGMNLEKSNRKPEYARAIERIKNGTAYQAGNHTWQHERWTRVSTEIRLSDWTKNQTYMTQLFGEAPTWIRFPYNDQNASAVSDAASLGLANLWGFDTNDWSIDRSASYLINRVLTQTSANNMARDGQVYVHHDHYDNQNSTRYALPEIAHYLRSKGIDYMTPTELSARNNITVVPGTTYNNFFLPSRITIGTQPAAQTSVTQGEITGSLSVSATVTPSATPSYQWYAASFADSAVAIDGATSATFTLPTDLTAGTYYYYCVASAPNAASVTSNVVAVTVETPKKVLFENGQWAPELGEITVHTPGAGSTWAYEDGFIRMTNNVPTSKNVAFRWVFENLVDMRGYDAVVIDLEEAPVGWFGGIVRFRIDQDACSVSLNHTKTIRMAAGTSTNLSGSNAMVGMSANNWDLQRLRGVGGLPAYGQSARIKRIYLEGDGNYAPVTINSDARSIPDIIPPRTGNTPVKEITSSGQYTGTVTWSPDHDTFQANTEYTATVTLTPKLGWTLDGVAANWFRIFNPTGTGTGATGTGSGTTHAAGSGVVTKTFPATKEFLPYPDPTQFVALSFDDIYLTDTEALVDALDQLGIKGTFFANGINLDKSRTNPDKKRALDKIVAGGHELGSHAYQHERYDNSADENVTRENFAKNQDVILELTGQTPRWSRIPYASQGTMSLRVVGEFGMTNLRGLATNDWDLPNSASQLVNTVLNATGNSSVRDGQIYVCHDQPGQTNTRQAIPEYYHELRSRGVGFMTISDLREHRNFTANPGVNYANFFQNSATPQVITINSQPTTPPAETLYRGNISGSLTVAATAAQGAALSYQWYVTQTATNPAVWTPVEGATSATCAVPADLTEGTYYFYCKVSASNAPSITTNVLSVTVLAPPTFQLQPAQPTQIKLRVGQTYTIALDTELSFNQLNVAYTPPGFVNVDQNTGVIKCTKAGGTVILIIKSDEYPQLSPLTFVITTSS